MADSMRARISSSVPATPTSPASITSPGALRSTMDSDQPFEADEPSASRTAAGPRAAPRRNDEAASYGTPSKAMRALSVIRPNISGMALLAVLVAGILPQIASVAGVATDSLQGGPLAGATVIVSDGGGRQTTTDAAGRFFIDSVPPGTHRIALFHPLLDALGFTVASAPLAFKAGDTVHIAIATPSPVVLLKSICTQDTAASGVQPTAIVGKVVGDADHATVTLQWKETSASRHEGLVERTESRQVTSDADGRFRVCSPPGVTEGRLRAAHADAATSWVPVELSR